MVKDIFSNCCIHRFLSVIVVNVVVILMISGTKSNILNVVVLTASGLVNVAVFLMISSTEQDTIF
jgi:hypothetical protein